MLYNKLLLDKDREEYKNVIESMYEAMPDTMARKFPRANIQQAWMYDQVKRFATKESKILCAGCYEDTAFEYLKIGGIGSTGSLMGIDPVVNFSLREYKNSLGQEEAFDVVFSTSVIEHVVDDEEFLDDMCKLLVSGGIGILTMDFNNDYRRGHRLPYTDVRFYTSNDLLGRFKNVLDRNGCTLLGEYDYSGKPDFEYDGCTYAFATYVFKKDATEEK